MAGATASPWWERRGTAALLALALAIPLVWPTIPPLTDVPSHLARYHIAIDGVLRQAFDYRWRLIGNLGVDLAVIPLAPLVGIERAGKLVILLIPVLTAGGMLALARAAHGRTPPAATFALPLALGWPFQLGFVNFCLGMALALWLIAGWIALASRPRLRGGLALPASWVVWTAHGFAWGLMGVMAFGAEVALRRRDGDGWPRAVLAAGVAALALATPLAAMLGGAATGASSSGWFAGTAKLAGVMMVLRDHWQALDIASVAVLLAVCVIAVRDRRLGLTPVLALPAALLFAAFLATPRTLFGGAFADARIAPYALALVLLAIRPPRSCLLSAGLAGVGVAFLAARVIAATVSLALAGAAMDHETAALAAIPHGTAVFALVRHDCEGGWNDRRLDHLPSLVILRRDAFVNDQWLMPGQQLLTIRPTGAAPFDHDPSQIASDRACPAAAIDFDAAVRRFPRWRYHYFWTIGFPRERVRDAGLVPVWRSDRSTLYRIVSATRR